MCSIAINFRFLFLLLFKNRAKKKKKKEPACRPSQLKGMVFRNSPRLARKLWKAVLL